MQSAELSRAYPDFYHESAHNILLDALTAQGPLGLAVLLGFLALGFYQATRVQDPPAGALGACLAAGLAANQFVVFTTPTAFYFYLTIAMLVALGKEAPVIKRRVNPYGCVLAVALSFCAIRLLVADRQLQQVKTAIDSGKTPAVEYSRVRSLGLTADIWYSRQMAASARRALDPVSALRAWQQALESGFRATRTAEDPHNAWYSLATLHARQNDFVQTERLPAPGHRQLAELVQAPLDAGPDAQRPGPPRSGSG